MTPKILPAERLANHRRCADLLPDPGPEAVRELLGHIEALEAELLAEKARADNVATVFGMSQKELAEARAECARLRMELLQAYARPGDKCE